jgi:anaerobic dimethyl sulfoxide reductase subunit A
MVTRRDFLKALSIISSGSFINLQHSSLLEAYSLKNSKEKMTWSACMVNCGSRCPLRVFTKNDIITRIETDNSVNDGENLYQIRACQRGRSIRKRVYSPERLKYPMKRIGKRGENKFVRISWKDALDEVAFHLKRIINNYGNDAIFLHYGTGTYQAVSGRNACIRFLNLIGGYLNFHNTYSTGQISTAMTYMYGTENDGSYPCEIQNSKLLVMFGNNPAETRGSGGGQFYEWLQAKNKAKVKTILIDPRYTDSALGKEDLWIPIRPGTDAALVEAIAYILINENLIDKNFLDKYCIGFDEKTLPRSATSNDHYKAHILGYGKDGIEKTPQWASKITGVPEDLIVTVAREIGSIKPCFISQGWGPQRHANGEQTCRAIAMLAVLTGNIGLPGTNPGVREGDSDLKEAFLPTGINPVKASIPIFLWTDAIVRGNEMTSIEDGIKGVNSLKTPIKFIWNFASNCLINQHSHINKTKKILEQEELCEFILVIDNQKTPSCQYADIILPDVTNLETNDVIADSYAVGKNNYLINLQPAIKPLFDSKPVYEICAELANRFGLKEKFTLGKTIDDWSKWIYDEIKKKYITLPAYREFNRKGIIRIESHNKESVAFKNFRKNPIKNPLNAPSGKIEIYSEQIAALIKQRKLKKDEMISPLPSYAIMWESHLDKKAKEYPLQLIGFHTKAHTHSTYYNISWLREMFAHSIWMNPIDAKVRNIKNEDKVLVFNDRGSIEITARVTPRIMPGVVAIGQGAWYQSDENGIDVGGCINTLTSQRPTPLGKANPQHTNLVEVQKIKL